VSEGKIRQLIEKAESSLKTGSRKAAELMLFQALGIANETRNAKFTSKIMTIFKNIGLFLITPQFIEIDPVKPDGLILDIGGGGEGVIGRLNGKQVVAIDTSERELAETHNEALKIVMDASELKFLPQSFHTCTAFFSMMYIAKAQHLKVFQEVHRVLRDEGKLLVWDVRIPVADKEYEQFIVPLKIQLQDELIQTGYGVKWQVQNVEYFKQLAQQVGFTIMGERITGETFYLEMSKTDASSKKQ
jgi:ubiquinone/menaquinone biosynthesis C-methylase UbiE